MLEQTTVRLADRADFAAMDAVWSAWVPTGHAPARARGETKLARDILEVGILMIAACD